jgi:hypothetical protein
VQSNRNLQKATATNCVRGFEFARESKIYGVNFAAVRDARKSNERVPNRAL